MKDKGMKLGVYTKDHGFMTVQGFAHASSKGAFPITISAPMKRIKPVQISAVEYRRIMAREKATERRMMAGYVNQG